MNTLCRAEKATDTPQKGFHTIALRLPLRLADILFISAMVLAALPGKRTMAFEYRGYLMGLLGLIELLYWLHQTMHKEPVRKKSSGDIAAVMFTGIIVWELMTSHLDLLQHLLFPVPGKVVAVFISELPVFARCLVSSLGLLGAGYLLALITAIPLALIIGWRKRLFAAVNPLTKVLGPIPPIVYIPYAIVILPTFKCASIFIIFIGAFWPIFIGTLNATFNVDRHLIDSARVLNVSEKTMLFEIILPGIMPAIISGATLGLVFSFILLTAAEMIGASSGLGWYVKYFSDFADYPRVVAGILFIGCVVTAITGCFERVERRLLSWKN
ncbi:ABC transporter permease [Desulfoluna sp.]|uniref:ABC transporter permease n=1 Tax=Desulfoluna sp. TaxID=2045199 RepID=UPI00262B5F32|nr:ABC transporter permease subunit [Desulfoluna sp.]